MSSQTVVIRRHLVRGVSEEEADNECLGGDLDYYELEDNYMEAGSPELESVSKPVFEDGLDLNIDEMDVDRTGGKSTWELGPAPEDGGGWGGAVKTTTTWGKPVQKTDAPSWSTGGKLQVDVPINDETSGKWLLLDVDLSGRLHVGDVGVCCLVRSNRLLLDLVLERCVGVTDKSLEAIGEAGCLHSLNLRGCYKTTDLGLKYLASGKLKKTLKRIALAGCDRISDDGIVHLKQMAKLGDLDLLKCGVNVTDSAILSVSEISNIRNLDLSWLINVTDTSLFNIASKCLKLETFNFSGCEDITGEGLRAFAHHPTLKTLDIFSCCNISWEDVVSVASTCMRLICLGLSRRM